MEDLFSGTIKKSESERDYIPGCTRCDGYSLTWGNGCTGQCSSNCKGGCWDDCTGTCYYRCTTSCVSTCKGQYKT